MPPTGIEASAPGHPIDLVYAWVDGNDPELHKDLTRLAERPEDRNPERTRDIYDLLRYSLRSAEKYLPWIRHVHVITRRPQRPSWLADDAEGISIVHHDELPGFDPYLPTFNSTAIESFVHAVPGVSDHFLYLNDDFLFGAPNRPEDYLTADGKHRVMGTYFGLWLPWRIYRRKWKIFNSVHLEHCPRFIYKPFWEEMLARYADRVHRTRSSRFRRGGDLRMDRLYRMWMLGPKRSHAEAVTAKELLRMHRFHRIDNDLEAQRRGLEEIRRMAPKHYCLNDDQGTEPDPDVAAVVRGFLNDQYPEPSSFERRESP